MSTNSSNQTQLARCVNCVCGNLAESSLAARLLGLCPILAVTTSVLKAFTIAILLLMVGIMSTLIGTILKSMVLWQLKPVYFAVLASVSTIIVVNAVGVYFPLLVDSLGIYALLIAANCQVLSQLQETAEHSSLSQALPRVIKDGCWVLVFAVIIAIIREFAAHGSLLHDWRLIYGLPTEIAPIGWAPLLADPAGALIVFAILLGMLNLFTQSRTRISPVANTDQIASETSQPYG